MSHILCNISGKNECAASVLQAQIQTLTQALEGYEQAVELAFSAKIHAFQTDEGRDYCQCGYYKTHPIHTLSDRRAASQKETASE